MGSHVWSCESPSHDGIPRIRMLQISPHFMGNHGTEWVRESALWCENPFKHLLLVRLRSVDMNSAWPDLVRLRFIHVIAKTSNLRDCFYVCFPTALWSVSGAILGQSREKLGVTEGRDSREAPFHSSIHSYTGDTGMETPTFTWQGSLLLRTLCCTDLLER